MPEIITRAEARARGLKRYFTGRLCSKGHLAERLVCNNRCASCAVACTAKWREAHPEYQRQNYAENRQKRRAWARDNYAKNAEKRRARNREKYARNPEKYRAYAARHYAKKRPKMSSKAQTSRKRVADLLAVLREEMPELLKEFGL